MGAGKKSGEEVSDGEKLLRQTDVWWQRVVDDGDYIVVACARQRQQRKIN